MAQSTGGESAVLTVNAQRLVETALRLQQEASHENLATNHWLLALLQGDSELAEELVEGLDSNVLVADVYRRVQAGEAGRRLSREAVVVQAIERARQRGRTEVTKEDVAAIILRNANLRLTPASTTYTPARPMSASSESRSAPAESAPTAVTTVYRCPMCGDKITLHKDESGDPIVHEHHAKASVGGALLMLAFGVGATLLGAVVLVLTGYLFYYIFRSGEWERSLTLLLVLFFLQLIVPALIGDFIGHAIFRAADFANSGTPLIAAIIGFIAGLILLCIGYVTGFIPTGDIEVLTTRDIVVLLIVGPSYLLSATLWSRHRIRHRPFCPKCARYMREVAA